MQTQANQMIELMDQAFVDSDTPAQAKLKGDLEDIIRVRRSQIAEQGSKPASYLLEELAYFEHAFTEMRA